MQLTRKKSIGVALLALGVLSAFWWVLANHNPATAKEDPVSEHLTLTTCQRYATQYYQQVNPEHFASIQLLEEDLNEEKYEDKVGSQFISTVLSGHGVWNDKSGEPSSIGFTCLLENSDKAVFFNTAEDKHRDPVDVCWDRFEPGEWGKMTQCLQDALKREETMLADLQGKAAHQAEQSMDKNAANQAFHESSTQWRKYRDTECVRRQAFVAGRNHPDIGELTCQIRKTDERISDLKFDE